MRSAADSSRPTDAGADARSWVGGPVDRGPPARACCAGSITAALLDPARAVPRPAPTSRLRDEPPDAVPTSVFRRHRGCRGGTRVADRHALRRRVVLPAAPGSWPTSPGPPPRSRHHVIRPVGTYDLTADARISAVSLIRPISPGGYQPDGLGQRLASGDKLRAARAVPRTARHVEDPRPRCWRGSKAFSQQRARGRGAARLRARGDALGRSVELRDDQVQP